MRDLNRGLVSDKRSYDEYWASAKLAEDKLNQVEIQRIATNDKLRAKYDEVFAAGQRYKSVVDEVTSAEKDGILTAEIAAAARNKATRSYNDQIQTLERLGRVQKDAAQRSVNQQLIVPDRGADIAAYAAQMDKLRLKFDPLFAAQKAYRAELAELKNAYKVGAIPAQEIYAKALDNVKERFAEQVRAIRGISKVQEEAVQVSVKSAKQMRDAWAELGGMGSATSQNMNASRRLGSLNYISGGITDVAGMDRARAKYDEIFAAGQLYKEGLAELRADLSVNAISEDLYVAALARKKAAFTEQINALGNYSRAQREAQQAAKDAAEAEARAAKAAKEAAEEAARARADAANKARVEAMVQKQTVPARNRERDISAFGDEYNRLRTTLVPLDAATQQFTKTQEDADTALKNRVISQDEHTAAVNRARATLLNQTNEIRKSEEANARLAKGVGLNAYAWQNLGFQINDVVTSLASGISPMQTIAQQGGQLLQVLQSAEGGVKGGLKDIGSTIASWASPLNVALAGFTALTAAATYLGYRFASSQREIERGLEGIGSMSGATASDINRAADIGSASGTISRGDARAMAGAVAATGRVDASNLAGVNRLASGYNRLSNKSAEETAAEFAAIFADPAKGADILNEKIGGLEAKTRDYIRTLQASGDRQGAVRELVRVFGPDLDRVADKTGAWARAWNAVATAADKAGEAVARPFTDKPLEKRIEQARRELADLERSAAGAPQRSIDYLTGEATGEAHDYGPLIARRRAELARMEAERADDAKRAAEKAVAERSMEAENAVRATFSDIQARKDLENTVTLLTEREKDAAAVAMMSVDARNKLKDAIAGNADAAERYMSVADKMRADDDLTLRSIQARTVAQRAEIAEIERRNALVNRPDLAPEQKDASARAAKQAVFDRALKEAEDQTRVANDNAAMAGLLPYRRRVAELDLGYRDKVLAARGSLETLSEIQKSYRADRYAVDFEAINGPLTEANQRLREQVAALKLQQDGFGASTEQVAKAAAQQDLANQYARQGIIDLTAYKDVIEAYGDAVGRTASKNEELAKKQREVIAGLDDMRSGVRGGITGIFGDLSRGKSPLDGILNNVQDMATRFLDRQVSGPLTESLLGSEGKAGGGLFGGFLTDFLGGKAGLSKADITAGVVNVSGTINIAPASLPALTGDLSKGGIPGLPNLAGKLDASSLTGDMGRYAQAIKDVESSGGNYGALGPLITRRNGSTDRAYGAYQVMGNNVGPWTQEVLGRRLTPEQFLGDKAAQDAVFQAKFGEAVNRYGNPLDAASVWLTGRPRANAGTVADINGTTSASYVRQFQESLSRQDRQLGRLDAYSLGGSVPEFDQMAKGLESASEGVKKLQSDLIQLPTPLAQTSQGLDQLGNSIGSQGGGLLQALASLFSGGSGTGAAAVTAAAADGLIPRFSGGAAFVSRSGIISGPGGPRSDGILAWVSNGEAIINAASVKRYGTDMIGALNENRFPKFADGNVTPIRPAPAWVPAQGQTATKIEIINNVPNVRFEEQEVPDGRGGRKQQLVVNEAVASGMRSQKGRQAMRQPFVNAR